MPKGLLQRCLQPLLAAAAVLLGVAAAAVAAAAAAPMPEAPKGLLPAGSNGCDAMMAFPGSSSTWRRECASLSCGTLCTRAVVLLAPPWLPQLPIGLLLRLRGRVGLLVVSDL
jgi:hypothetical protein